MAACLLIYANLSGMAPESSNVAHTTFYPDSRGAVSNSDAAEPAESNALHPSQFCPNCGNQLAEHRCKLVCNQCGYYMSCADYY